MKKLILTFSGLIFMTIILFAQQKSPTLLKSPADWGFERMDFPLGFAPGIKFIGFEEIRFAPGWMDTTSINYFTYAYVVSMEGQKKFTKADIKDFLDNYYKGLSVAIGQSKKLIPDTSAIAAEVVEIKSTEENQPSTYTAIIPYFDTFSNGRKISLSLELDYVIKTDLNRTFLTVLVSASTEKSIWDKLHEIRKGIVY